MAYFHPAPPAHRFLPPSLPLQAPSFSNSSYHTGFGSHVPSFSSSTATTSSDLRYSPPHQPRAPPLIMSCPRDVRPDYTAGKGYGDVHGTEEHPGISLLTEPAVLHSLWGGKEWLSNFPDWFESVQVDTSKNAIPSDCPRFYAPPPNAPPSLHGNFTLPRLEHKPLDPRRETPADYECGINKHRNWVPCNHQCPHQFIAPSLDSLMRSGRLTDVYNSEGKVERGRVDVSAEVIPWWSVKRAGPVKREEGGKPLAQSLKEMDKGLVAAKEMISDRMESIRKRAMRVEKRRSPKRSPRRLSREK